jgi:hypothetical protein
LPWQLPILYLLLPFLTSSFTLRICVNMAVCVCMHAHMCWHMMGIKRPNRPRVSWNVKRPLTNDFP